MSDDNSLKISIKQIEKYFKHLMGIIYWKDSQSVYMGGNTPTTDLFGFRSEQELIGKSDAFLNCKASESHVEFASQDLNVIKHNSKLDIIDINIFADGNISVWHTRKMPIVNEFNKPFAVLGQSLEVKDPAFINRLLKFLLNGNNKGKLGSYTIGDIVGEMSIENLLSEKELESLYYYIKGYSANQIGSTLNRSKRTIETHLLNIKNKYGCNSKADLVELGILLGLQSYIPKSFFNVKTY